MHTEVEPLLPLSVNRTALAISQYGVPGSASRADATRLSGISVSGCSS